MFADALAAGWSPGEGGGRRQERGAGGDRSLVGRRCARRWRSADEPTVADAGREVRRPLLGQMAARLRRRRAAPSRQQGAGSRGPLDAWTGVWRRRRSGPAVRIWGLTLSASQVRRRLSGVEAWALGDCGLRAAAIAGLGLCLRYVACDTLGGWAARLWAFALCCLLSAPLRKIKMG